MAIGASQTTLSSAGTSESVTFANPTTSLSLTTGTGNDQITISGVKPAFSVIVDPGAGTNKITDQTGYAVARFDGTNGTDTIRLMQTTTKAIMAYVNNSITTCTGVNGFDIENQGGTDQITLQGTHTFGPRGWGIGKRYRRCLRLPGKPHHAERREADRAHIGHRHVRCRHLLPDRHHPGDAGGHDHELLRQGPDPERHPGRNVSLAFGLPQRTEEQPEHHHQGSDIKKERPMAEEKKDEKDNNR